MAAGNRRMAAHALRAPSHRQMGGHIAYRLAQLAGVMYSAARPSVVLLLELVTGLCLALVYSPSADNAWQSLLYLNYQQPFGWYLRALHYWGSNFLVALMILHLLQVFVLGAYKFPRELTWISGILMLLLTLVHGVDR